MKIMDDDTFIAVGTAAKEEESEDEDEVRIQVIL